MADRTHRQFDDVRARLIQRKEVLAREIEEVRSHLAEGIDDDVDAVRDAAAAGAQTGVDHAMVARDLQEVRDIDAALRRIEDGGFGICIDCGVTIEPRRIAAYPTAKRCLPCQLRHERAQPR